MRLPHILLLALGLTLSSSDASAVPVTENFTGNVSLLSPGNLGDAGSDIYSMNVVQTQGLATISYDVAIRTRSGLSDSSGNSGIHFDTRGFGDTAGNTDALESSWTRRESFEVSIANLQVSASPGFSVISENIVVEFDSFDLVNHNSNNPTVFWLDDTSTWGFTTATGGTSGAIETVSGMGSGATKIDIYAYRRQMWINNVVTWFDGQVTVDVDITAVPEPSSVGFLVGLILFTGRRRRRI